MAAKPELANAAQVIGRLPTTLQLQVDDRHVSACARPVRANALSVGQRAPAQVYSDRREGVTAAWEPPETVR